MLASMPSLTAAVQRGISTITTAMRSEIRCHAINPLGNTWHGCTSHGDAPFNSLGSSLALSCQLLQLKSSYVRVGYHNPSSPLNRAPQHTPGSWETYRVPMDVRKLCTSLSVSKSPLMGENRWSQGGKSPEFLSPDDARREKCELAD